MPNHRRKRISQTQIAGELGYSQALVSMVLNGRKQGISELAYNRIWEYATTHGYSPRGMDIDNVARSTTSPTIGYILRSPLKLANKSNFFNHIHQGLFDYLDEKGVKMVFLGSENHIDIDRLPEFIQSGHNISGIAIMGEVQQAFLSGVIKLGLPLIYISARATGLCHSVLANEQQSATFLVDHLVELGHKTFAWLGGNKSMGRHSERYQGVVNALRLHGLKIDPKHEAKIAGADRMEGYNAAKKIIHASNHNIPTAWICLNGLMARGAISYLFQNGLRVPKDVSVAAIDMTNVCTEENPQITCASASPEHMGLEAARLLLESIKENKTTLTDITLPSQIKVLESTGVAKHTKTINPITDSNLLKIEE